MTQEIWDVALMYVRCPEPRGEGVPKIMEVEIAEPGSFDRSFKTDHHLTAFPSRALWVEDKVRFDPVALINEAPHEARQSAMPTNLLLENAWLVLHGLPPWMFRVKDALTIGRVSIRSTPLPENCFQKFDVGLLS
jgi:hypothetical protein